MKKIYLIRHAESEANIATDLDNPTYYYDPKITKNGFNQALKARKIFNNMTFDKYICSPFTRTLQTFSIIFPEKIPLIQPLIREHSVNSSEVGKQPNILKKEFPQFDFSKLNKYWWNNDKPINEKKIIKENMNDIKIRLDKFKSWLDTDNSFNIAIVSHGTFLSQISGYLMENCEHFIWQY